MDEEGADKEGEVRFLQRLSCLITMLILLLIASSARVPCVECVESLVSDMTLNSCFVQLSVVLTNKRIEWVLYYCIDPQPRFHAAVN